MAVSLPALHDGTGRSTQRRAPLVLTVPTQPGLPVLGERHDRALLARARAGDQGAFRELYVRNLAAVQAVARRICAGEPTRAEEVVQDVFLAAWRSLAGDGIAAHDPSRGGVGAWLVTITRARAIDAMRAVRLQQARGHSSGGEEQLDQIAAPEETDADLLQAETVAELRSAVAELPRAQREVVELAYFSELTHAEIAERLILPIGTVKGRLRLSYERLRRPLRRTLRTR